MTFEPIRRADTGGKCSRYAKHTFCPSHKVSVYSRKEVTAAGMLVLKSRCISGRKALPSVQFPSQ
jgi:hypothetical protein